MIIRPATTRDAASLASLHIQVWKETYRGIMPDSVLDNASLDQRTKNFETRILNTSTGTTCLIVAEVGTEIAGFASSGPTRESVLGTDSEVYAINILNRFKRQGLGRKLMCAAAQHLSGCSFRTAGLWVLEKNAAAIGFYRHLGGRSTNSAIRDFDGIALIELAYTWPSPSELVQHCSSRGS